MRLVSLKKLTPDDLSAWSRLASRAAEPNPFVEPEFVLAASQAQRTRPPELLVHEEGEHWKGCVPVRVRGRAGPFDRSALLTTWTHRFADVGTPLVEKGHVEEFADALTAHLADRRHGSFLKLQSATDAVVVEKIRTAVARSGRLEAIYERTSERAAIERRAEADAYLASLKPRRRRDFEKRRRRLSETVDAEVRVADRAASPAAIDEFLRLEASGWKGIQGTALRSEGDSGVFRAICQRFGQVGRLQLLALEAEGETLAMQCNISAGDTLFNFKVAFDERFRRYAPGIQLEIEAMRIFHTERSEALFDSCANPTNELLNRLWPDRLPITTLVIGPNSPGGRAAGRLLEARHRREQRNRSQ